MFTVLAQSNNEPPGIGWYCLAFFGSFLWFCITLYRERLQIVGEGEKQQVIEIPLEEQREIDRRALVVYYWAGLVSLYIHALLIVFHLSTATEYFRGEMPKSDIEEHAGVLFCMCLSVLPFFVPLLLAVVTGVLTGNAMVGLAAFVCFSIIQIVFVGVLSGSERFTQRFLAMGKLALPIIAFVVQIVRTIIDYAVN